MNPRCNENNPLFKLFLLEVANCNQIYIISYIISSITSWRYCNVSSLDKRIWFSSIEQKIFQHRICVRITISKVYIIFRDSVSIRKSKRIIKFIIFFITNRDISFPIFDVSTSSHPFIPIRFGSNTNFHSWLKNWIFFNEIQYMESDFACQFVYCFEEKPLSTFCCVHITKAS